MKCQSMVEACVHPTTHEIIPFYGRMASFVPVNIPVCAGTTSIDDVIVSYFSYFSYFHSLIHISILS